MVQKKFIFVIYSIWSDCNTLDRNIDFHGAYSTFGKAKIACADFERIFCTRYFVIRKLRLY